MRKLILTLLLTLGPIISYGQSRSEFEVMSGRAIGLEDVRYDSLLPDSERHIYVRGRSVFGAAWRYDIYKGFRIGMKYMFSPSFSTGSRYKYQAHSATLTAEIDFCKEKSVAPFLAAGAGPQYVHRKAFYKDGDSDRVEFGNLCAETGVIIKQKCRISAGAHLGNCDRPFAYLTLGWLF
ncbi:MAG: hypothetical protein IJJ96_06100 [Bacteroidales bacterium]|nr:hypothetical protein [Bacteroidales bacterium]